METERSIRVKRHFFYETFFNEDNKNASDLEEDDLDDLNGPDEFDPDDDDLDLELEDHDGWKPDYETDDSDYDGYDDGSYDLDFDSFSLD